ncbi:hypothetical protein LCGC14_1627270 [marine sediment metagenome]|uniref:Uncharacterized protein n=1 Tax=marine sediment metagenome TaxID=412755 RepID=A0A0F9IQQ9_9ZZZZ
MKPPPTRPRKLSAAKTPMMPPGQKKEARQVKKFATATYETAQHGKRIIVYADSGMGKTTLTALLGSPKFIDFRGGSDMMLHPITGERLVQVPNVKTFDDVRDVCNQDDLLVPGDSLIIDVGDGFEDTALDWTIQNVPHEKGPGYKIIKRIEDYGYGKGYRHLYDTMKLPLADFDTLIRRGVNIVINCQMQQIEVPNTGGENFLCDVPKLQAAHGKNNNVPPVWGLYVEWADHVFKIGYSDLTTHEGKASSTGEHVVIVHGGPQFKAKSRSIPYEYPRIAFSSPADDSIWQYLFDECWKEEETNQ